jgi:uncharacterized protein (DUF1684 family)
MTELETFREQKDQFFGSDRHSPLQWDQKKNFSGLKYFPDDPGLRLEVEVEEFPEKDEIEIQTSTGTVQTYSRYGRFTFTVDGQEAALTIYEDSRGFFLPFADALAGKETYGAGRYLEPVQLSDNRFLIDFNYAYNPYCAYNDAWTCPLTPFENRLKVPVRAGEKIFKEEEVGGGPS